MPTEDPPLFFRTRVWLAWLCFFRVLSDRGFAARAWRILHANEIAPSRPATLSPSIEATPMTSALQLLSLFQREGRFVDFLEQDIAAFPDADVGGAARVVHEGCRTALRRHAQIDPVRSESEGARVELDVGFDSDEVKLVGDVRGDPPYAGVLRHRGWRATKLELPRIVGEHDARLLSPAEVELG